MAGGSDLQSALDSVFGFSRPPDSIALRLLGLSNVPASSEEVMAAFRSRVAEVHPDTGLAEESTTIEELIWARAELLSRLPSVTASNRDHGDDQQPSRRPLGAPRGWGCQKCKGERLDYRGRPYRPVKSWGRWSGLCRACAVDAENERQRDRRLRLRSDRSCSECGDIFTPSRSDAQFCSTACRQRAYRKRKAE